MVMEEVLIVVVLVMVVLVITVEVVVEAVLVVEKIVVRTGGTVNDNSSGGSVSNSGGGKLVTLEWTGYKAVNGKPIREPLQGGLCSTLLCRCSGNVLTKSKNVLLRIQVRQLRLNQVHLYYSLNCVSLPGKCNENG